MSVSVAKLCKKHKISISVRQTKNSRGIYIFASHFVFLLLGGECRGHFLKMYLSVMFFPWSTKLFQLSRFIFSMLSGIIIVTVNI